MQAVPYILPALVYTAPMPAGRPAKHTRSAFGDRLAHARHLAGLTQEQLARKLGITQRVLSHWERAPVALRAEQLMALATALHVSADFLLGREPATPRTSGPAGKARRAFEQVSQLPRHQQQKIIEVVEALVAQQTAR